MILDRYSCGETFQVTLNNPDLFVIDIGMDTQINLGAVYIFPVESNYSIVNGNWEGSELSCLACIENSARPLEQGRYNLTVMNENGCSASDSILITITEIEDQFFKPNIFSPNQDGVNDLFQLYTSSLAIDQVEKFTIIDRWGNIIHDIRNVDFQSESMQWDGSSNSMPAKVGVYSYFIQLKLINGKSINLAGDVTLIR
jgi:gliding motility-associated-like protein